MSFRVLGLLALAIASTGCLYAPGPCGGEDSSAIAAMPSGESAPVSEPAAAESWTALLQKRPHPYTTPLPDGGATVLDGIYVKLEPKEGTPVPCRRCPDYLPEGGIWRLSLDKGAFRIFHEDTHWQSLGSFAVDGERLFLFNDPTCYRMTGIYGWEQVEGGLDLKTIEDRCQVDRRARSFAGMVWQSCQPPSTEAATTGHWRVPVACEVGKD